MKDEGANPRPLADAWISDDLLAEAIAVSHANAVDTASGIETAPGLKNVGKMLAFAEQANRAFDQSK